ncbi:MAG: hypothetical protein JRD89_01660, partial [Deltaproteobacteria bacterium]|nr:hypothetical protein [Deltaproteobacteria bacterium]
MKTEFFKGWMRPEDFPPQEGLLYQLIAEVPGTGYELERDCNYYKARNVFESEVRTLAPSKVLGYKAQEGAYHKKEAFEFLEPSIDWTETVRAQRCPVCETVLILDVSALYVACNDADCFQGAAKSSKKEAVEAAEKLLGRKFE